MSPAHTNNSRWMAPEVAHTIYQRSLAVGILFGAAALALALYPNATLHARFFQAYLLGYMFWLGITLGSMVFLMIQHLTGGAWGMVIRRPAEAAIKTLPLLAVMVIPIFVGAKSLYVWARPEDVAKDAHLIEITREYLKVGGTPHFLFLDGIIGRAVVYFIIWGLVGRTLVKWSREQDVPPVQNLSPRFRKIAGPGLILYAFTITFASIDWVMSLDPHWVSTIFGFIIIVGQCLAAISFMVVVETILCKYEPYASWLKPKEVHDHGKLMLTFLMLWAYFSFSQLLIIWAGNLPQEIRFYTRRLYNGWEYVGLALVIFQFAIPFALLLSRPFKRNPHMLVRLAVWILFMRFLDLFWYIEPAFNKVAAFHWGYVLDLVVPIAIGGLWLAYFFRNLRMRPLLPEYDLHAQEFLDYAGVAHD